ncbi:hypothetical protein TI39_contig4100g00022 [Zymoseptoria brevis]|uniref:F-box domain-containing protein n=1 Tax=Zymoseptoria brevis TaxID=1047168 RepID=A0A0F4GE68_9PEZI|nr:hypothetical protein TI39_contig4100g00022 [Zymoseptoria brevis]
MSEGGAPTMDTVPPSKAQSPPSTSVAMSSAASNVFGTAELLELILLDVDMRTLLLGQRVSKDFNNTITSSPSLQEKLFFRVKRNTIVRGENPGDPEVNSLLCARDICEATGLVFLHVEVQRTLSVRYGLSMSIGFGTLMRIKALKDEDADGSWRRMLVVQPVSRTGDFWRLSYESDLGPQWSTYVGTGKWCDAMTLEALIQTLLKRVGEGKDMPWSKVEQEIYSHLDQLEAEEE